MKKFKSNFKKKRRERTFNQFPTFLVIRLIGSLLSLLYGCLFKYP